MSANSFSRSRVRALVLVLALAGALLGCSKPEAELPSPTTPGAYIAAKESKTGRYRLYHVVSAEPLPEPIGMKLHLVAYDETTKDFDEAKRVFKHGTLRPIHENVVVLARDFFQREHQVVGYRAPKKDESASTTKN